VRPRSFALLLHWNICFDPKPFDPKTLKKELEGLIVPSFGYKF
jgi:hypothetical protein